MAFTLKCGDVMPGCTATFEASSQSELLDLVAVHAAVEHALVDLDEDVVAMVTAAIRTT